MPDGPTQRGLDDADSGTVAPAVAWVRGSAGPHIAVALRWLVRVVRQASRRWTSDRCTTEAASFAFKTALGIVPFIAIAFTLLKALGKIDERSAFIEFFANNLFPSEDARPVLAQAVLDFADKIGSGAMGSLGTIILIVTVFLLFYEIESFWNRVWSAPRQRSMLSKFFVFYTLATLTPFLLAISLYHTAHYWRSGAASYFAPMASTFAALLLANRLLPAVRVKWHYAALGALVSALLFELAKRGFARYVTVVIVRYKSIYGAIGIVPLFLLWIYVAWLCVLLGAEVAHASQRLSSLEAGDRRRRRGSDPEWELISGPTAARMLVHIAQRYTDGKGAPTAPELAEAQHLPEEVVVRLLARLSERGLVMEIGGDRIGWLTARPPSQITLNEVLAAFRVTDPEAHADALDVLLAELDALAQKRADVTLAELAQPPPAPAK